MCVQKDRWPLFFRRRLDLSTFIHKTMVFWNGRSTLQ
jgi:hypothetical protein